MFDPPVPYIIEAERNKFTVRCYLMNTTTSHPFEIQTIGIHHSMIANREEICTRQNV